MEKQEFLQKMIEGDWVHTFRNPNGMLIGADLERNEVLKMLDEAARFGDAGETANRMKHGLFIESKEGRMVFVATREETK